MKRSCRQNLPTVFAMELMDSLKNFFDDFTFQARVMPIVVVVFPIIAVGILNGVFQGGWAENSDFIVGSLIFLVLCHKVARNCGKAYEKKMFQELGAMPSTIALRFKNEIFDDVTKKRYHQILNQFRGLNLPLDQAEETPDSDQQYSSAANILRNYANSNRKTEYRVYQELKEYNFWRNLYGIKPFVLLCYFAIIIREIIVRGPICIKDIFLNPFPDYTVLIIMILSSAILIASVNQQSVRERAFDYAKALIEVCERISAE
ncbi:hypothetical protein [Dysosmobacter sp.]